MLYLYLITADHLPYLLNLTPHLSLSLSLSLTHTYSLSLLLQIVLRRFYMSRINRPPVSVSKLATHLKGHEKQTAVVVGTITDDSRMVTIPKMTVCALRFTENARRRIVAAGGECLTFDQLALRAPKGQNTILLQGNYIFYFFAF